MSQAKKKSAGGVKYDQEKPRMDLLDSYAITELAKVLTYGAKKYSAHNWRDGIQLSRLIAASMRHLTALNGGETVDPETGLSHAAHLMCNAMFMTWNLKNRPELDDRYQEPKRSRSLAHSGKQSRT